MDDPRHKKHFHSSRLVFKPDASVDMTVDWWVDQVYQTQKTVNLAGSYGTLPFTLGTDRLGGEELIDLEFDLNIYGKRIQFDIYNSTANEDFHLAEQLLDYRKIHKETN